MTTLALVRSDEINAAFATCRNMIRNGLRRGDGSHTVESIEAAVRADQFQMWVIVGESGVKAALFTEVVKYPARKVCIIQYAVGPGALNDLLRHVDAIEAWAGRQGCDATMVPGRKGWGPALTTKGYVEVAIILEKPTCRLDARAAALAAE